MEQPVHHGRQSKVLIYNVDKDRNVGMIIRSAAAMGVSEVVVAGRKSKKLNTFGSQGTHKQLPMRHVPVFDDAVAELKRDGFHFIGVEIVDNAKPVDEVPFGENNAKIVFLFGNEGTGMSAPARRACDAFVRIRQFAPRTASLNVACAASIVLHAWACWAGLKEAPFAQEKFQVPDDLTLIVGTYTSKMGHVDGKGQGIYRVKVNPNTGLLTDAELLSPCKDPSYVFCIPSSNRIISIDEGGGDVSVWYYSSEGDKAPLIASANAGVYPCHVYFDEAESEITVAGYGGTLSRFRLEADGRVTPMGLVQHETFLKGSMVNAQRQEKPHVHFFSSWGDDEDFGIAVDLGADALVAYKTGELRAPAGGNAIQTIRGGPRHAARHPFLRGMGYVCTELSNKLFRFSVLEKDGSFDWSVDSDSPSLIPEGIGEMIAPSAGAIVVHPSGKFLFVSVRDGPRSFISTFSLSSTGTPSLSYYTLCAGECPRDIVLTPDGSFLLSANQNSSTITCFSVDPADGKLTRTQQGSFPIPTPSCLKFWE